MSAVETEPEIARMTADIALFGTHDGQMRVLMIRRAHDPFKGRLALPGGHVDTGEHTLAAAYRELFEETGLTVEGLEPVGVYATPGRDPRGRYATWLYSDARPAHEHGSAGRHG